MSSEPMRLYQKTARAWAVQMPCDFTVQSPEGLLRGGVGDWIVMDEQRSPAWIVAKDTFAKTYREVTESW